MNSPIEGEEEAIGIKRQGADQAIQLALESKWEEATALNHSIVAARPSNVDAWNRLGKALLELGRFREASEAYGTALGIDPLNSIAKRNLDRLVAIKEDEEPRRVEATAKIAQDLFIEEVGKSGVTMLNGASPEVLARLTAGDEVYLKPGDELIGVENIQGDLLGSVEPKLGLRLLRLIEGGNRYAAAVKSVSESEAELIIKEIYRDPSQTKLSFPAVRGEGVKPNIKESLLRFEEDEEESEEEAESEEWEGEPKPAEQTVSLSTMERDADDEDDEEA